MKVVKNPYLKKWPFVGLIVFALISYIILFALRPEPPNNNPLRVSSTATVILSITILIPYFSTWILSAMSWYRFKLISIVGKKIGWDYEPGFSRIGQGVGLLVLDLLGTSMFSSIRSLFIYDYHSAMILTIIYNLFHIIVPMAAFIFIYLGSRELASKGHYAAKIRSNLLTAILPAVALTILFCMLVFSSFVRQFPPGHGELSSYYLADSWIVLLIILPLFFTWFIALRAALNIELFTHSLGSASMRRAIIRFYNGLLAVIGSSIILQALQALGTPRLLDLGLLQLLLLFYFWITIQAAAYWWLAGSARELYRLIEVEDKSK